VFADHGFHDITIANEVVTLQKIRRLCALARRATLTVAVDHPENVRHLSEAAGVDGVTLQVMVDIHTRLNRCGVEPGQPAVALARTVQVAPHLDFVGLMTYAGSFLPHEPGLMATETRRCIQQVLDTRQLIERAGIAVRVVSAGNTSNYEIAGAMAGVTEVPAGAYALLDARYGPHRPQFTPAARVLTTVSSRPEPATAITDAGQKAVSVDLGLPVAADLAGATVASLSAEHCRLRLEGATTGQLHLGETLWLTPQDIGTCVNLYDYIHAVREGRLEAVWRVAARGQYR
jgi:D-serine deaminase-like pyridoxal phosphate-dependent protein